MNRAHNINTGVGTPDITINKSKISSSLSLESKTNKIASYSFLHKFFTLVLLLFTSVVFSQNNDGWELLFEKDGIEISYKKEIVAGNEGIKIEYVVFSFQNKSGKDIRLSYKLDLWYGEHCRSCNLPSPNEYELSLSLSNGLMIVGKAGEANKTSSVISRMIMQDSANSGITKIELRNVLIETI